VWKNSNQSDGALGEIERCVGKGFSLAVGALNRQVHVAIRAGRSRLLKNILQSEARNML
jgi:hypothetical protein